MMQLLLVLFIVCNLIWNETKAKGTTYLSSGSHEFTSSRWKLAAAGGLLLFDAGNGLVYRPRAQIITVSLDFEISSYSK